MGASNSRGAFPDIVQQLLQTDIDPADHDFWDELWKYPLSANDIFTVISPDDVRKLINERPKNLQTLFTQAIAQLYQVVETPYPVYFDQALTCTRFLTRLLPIMLESESKSVRELFWNRQVISKSAPSTEPEHETDNNNTNDTKDQITNSTKSDKDINEKDKIDGNIPNETDAEPLAVILINSMFHLLFLPDFTMDDPNIDFNESDLTTQTFKSALMWAPGVGSSEKSVVSSSQYDRNRIDILRLMIASFSDSLYQDPDSYDSSASLWLEVATSVDAPYADIVFYSLMNVVLAYDPIGWGIPYGSFVSTDTAKPLQESAIQALLILLDYGNPIATVDIPATAPNAALPYVSPEDTDAQGFNIFRRLMSSIHASDQLNFIYRGFVRLLNNLHESESTYLPYSITRVEIEQELLILLWKCLEEIPRFMPFVLRHCDVNEIVVPICYLLLEGRKDASKLGLMYLCTFILLKLSGERSFGVALNKTYALHLPVDLPLFSGIHADLVVIVLHKIIVSGLDKLSALYNCFLTIICNISPYCKTLSAVASVKLVNLFQLFTSPKYLYATEANHAHVSILLETFNNMVQYQYEGNVNIVYALVRRKDIFEHLSTLTLEKAIEAAKEIANKSKQRRSDANKAKGSTSTSAAAATSMTERGKEEPALESKPTDLISTRSIERHVGIEEEKERIPSTSSASSTLSTTPTTNKSDSPTNATSTVTATDTSSVVTNPVHSATLTHDSCQTSSPEKTVSSTVTEGESGTGVASDMTSSSTSAALIGGDEGEKEKESDGCPTELRFVPTIDWLEAVKAEVPLNTIMRLLKHLVPHVEEMASHGSVDEIQVLDYIRRTTMVGLLPVPHPIVIRKYQPNKFTSLWFTAFLWGVVFMHNQEVPLFDGRSVKLFMVQSSA
mmetsp:Transcript_33988/g.34636  ORF Transcript_33988/g.34636 Transcript_33988/m.34636 type:complete len:901 (-) Transcript_33988:376-3078(-)